MELIWLLLIKLWLFVDGLGEAFFDRAANFSAVDFFCSYIWRKLLQLRHEFKPFVQYVAGDGKKIFLCDGSLESIGTLGGQKKISYCWVYDTSLPRDATVAVCNRMAHGNGQLLDQKHWFKLKLRCVELFLLI
ncbi:Aminoacyl-tRNA hydrolase [Psidium guajava]|nr:Aminoacyl-tRNA hydrolase [Psidium guajava]